MSILAKNKKATFNYEILEKYEAGIELKGFEVKSLKTQGASLAGSYVTIKVEKDKIEAFWVNAKIRPYQPENLYKDYNEQRDRKLLLKKNEIIHLYSKTKEKGLTLMPIMLYTKKSFIKMELGLVRGKKKHDKRETIKKRELDIKISKEMKSRG